MARQDKGPLLVLYERLYVVVIITAAAVAGAFLISARIKPVFRAQTKCYRPSGAEVFSLSDEGAGVPLAPRMPTGSDEVQASLLGILRSAELRGRVAAELARRGLEGRDSRFLEQNVKFDIDKFNMLVITAWDTVAADAARVANTYYQEFHDHLKDLTLQDMAETRRILDASISKAEEELRTAMAAKMNFMTARDSVDYAVEFETLSSRIRTLRTAIADIEINSATVDTRAAEIQAQIDERPEWSPGARVEVRNPQMVSVMERLARVRQDLEGKKLRYTEAHPEVVKTLQEISLLSQQLADMPERVESSETENPDPLRQKFLADLYDLRRQKAVYDVEVAARTSELSELMEKWRGMPEYKAQLDLMEEDITKRRATLDMLRSRREELRIQEARQFNFLEVVEVAQAAASPTYPRTKLNMSVAAILGLISGITFVVLMSRVRAIQLERLW